jgi:D-arginine dehydrogenase
MVCPMDETPSAPCDAKEDRRAIDEALARVPKLAPGLQALRAHECWAGLRTFSDDGAPVVGFDAEAPNFFWLAGQGGCGMETAAALSEIAADLLLNGSTARFDAATLDPCRFRRE